MNAFTLCCHQVKDIQIWNPLNPNKGLSKSVLARRAFEKILYLFEACMSCSFGKQPLGANGKRGTDCLVLEYSEMIVVRALNALLTRAK